MKRLLKRRPSAALVISIVALVMATIGTAIAATQLPKNSVGSKQLKNNAVVTSKIKKEAVTGAKVKKNSLTGKNINLSSLGTVPSATNATNATTAATAQALTPPEPIHVIGAPGEPQFEEGAKGVTEVLPKVHTQPPGFYKDREGVVHLVGLVTAGENGALFRLPAGFRPANGTVEVFEQTEHVIFVVGSGVQNGEADGLVILFTGSKGDGALLSGITFRAGG